MMPMGDAPDPGMALVRAAVARAQAKGIGKGALASMAGLNRSHLGRVEKGDRGLSLAAALNLATVVETTLGALLGEPQPAVQDRVMTAGDALAVGIPLVADEIAAGNGSLPEVPDDRVYWFREKWLSDLGYRTPGRFACIRLGNDAKASSMLPTIPPKSVVLIDRKARRDRPPNRSIWLVEDEGGPVVKRVTLVDAGLVIESDNPAPQYHARFISLKDRPVQDVLRGRAVWWAVEAE